MEKLLADVRYAVRTLLKRPVFAAVAVLTLALGIGANTAIFSVVNSVLLNPLPYEKPGELVLVWGRNLESSLSEQPASWPDFMDIKEQQSESFEQVAATRSVGFTVAYADEPERVNGARVTTNLLAALRVKPALGRDFEDRDGQKGADPVAIISYGLWQQRFGGDSSVVGRTLAIDNQSYTVVGILPEGFYYPVPDASIYVPLVPQQSELRRGARFIKVIARLRSSVSPEQASAEMDTIASRVAAAYPDTNDRWGLHIVPLHEQVVGRIRPALVVLFGAVACVLLIACANVANLLLARAAARRTEFAIRIALGASRARLIRQLLTESVLLSLIGGALGLLVALWGVPALTNISAGSIPRAGEVGVSNSVLVFTIAISLITGIAFGIAPALQSSTSRLSEDLKESRKGGAGGVVRRRLLKGLVVAEVAVALVLLVGAGLMIRSFISISNVASGFNPERVLSMNITLSPTTYAEIETQGRFYERLIAKIEPLPGVKSAAGVSRPPLVAGQAWTSFTVQGRPVPQGSEPAADYRTISPDYFKTMGIRVLKGREFTWQDAKDAPDCVVINEMMVERFFPGEDPIGRRIQIYPDPTRWREVVGVVANVKLETLDAETRPAIYAPLYQNPYPAAIRNAYLVVRASADPRSLVAAIREQIKSIDKDAPVAQVQTMEEVISNSLAQRRLNMSLLVVFAVLAALLAAVGIYGVMAYSVAERTHEIGVRMALGATSGDVLRMILIGAARLAAAGVALGLVAAFALTRVMSSLLFGVSAADPLTYIFIAALLSGVALLASYVPARKAARVDPMVALRYD